MFRSALRPISSSPYPRSARTARFFHRVTTDFITHDTRGNLVTRKVPVIVSDPGETYVLIEQGVGSTLRAASPFISASAASAEDSYQLTFFHDSVRESYSAEANSLFSLLGSTSYPRLYVPSQISRQTELNISPATLFIGGKIHHLSQILPVLRILIHDTYLAIFAENANATRRSLESVLDQLKDI
ncbi:uncharacterized protein N7518_004730 [Penicillium psychrosexuale]|uniref:uncharacterized protein n=1 Tax=Penicillium psychrosexuale TaxID=1002107 RepID=UPI002544FC23|nr:uncharacterized protein N7518_004730 [Penicillium psychrosexuale]KAJ5796190.1 hypothetical protein N7518_004730 [Penicillium psychrosexuale]